MPTFSRRALRQRLGQRYLRDTIVGQTTGSWSTTAGSFNIVDARQADPTASGEQMHFRHWLRLLGSAGLIQDLRVGSFNTGSGAFVGAQTLATTIVSGMPFEIHALLSPAEKDEALDAVIEDVRVREEVAIWATPQAKTYSLGDEIANVVEVGYLSDPTSSLHRGGGAMPWWKLARTGSGHELRVSSPLLASQQLVVDALLSVSLGAGDLATVRLPDEEWVLTGAAARCFWLLEQRAPGQEAAAYRERRQEMAREFTRLSARFGPVVAKRIQLDEPW